MFILLHIIEIVRDRPEFFKGVSRGGERMRARGACLIHIFDKIAWYAHAAHDRVPVRYADPSSKRRAEPVRSSNRFSLFCAVENSENSEGTASFHAVLAHL